jgi:hypothetical protein
LAQDRHGSAGHFPQTKQFEPPLPRPRPRAARIQRRRLGPGQLLLCVLANAALAVVTTPAAALVSSCGEVDQLQIYYRGMPSATITYNGEAAAALLRVLSLVAGAPPGNPAVRVVLGVNLVAGDADFFLYDAKDCGVAMMGPVSFAVALRIVEMAGLDTPFHEQSFSRTEPGTE